MVLFGSKCLAMILHAEMSDHGINGTVSLLAYIR